MYRTLTIALPLALYACSSAEPIDQGGADALALEVVAERVVEDAPYRLVRGGTVQAGVAIVEGDPTATEEEPATETTPSEPGFLFLLDLAPRSYFAHAVDWIVVGESGEVTVQPARWWPRVGAEVPEGLLEALEDDTEGLVDARDWVLKPSGVAPVFDIPRLDLAESNAYIVVQGLLPWESLHDDASATGELGRDFFTAYQDALSETIYLAEDDADTVLEVIEQAATQHGTVTVAMLAHGSVDGVSLGGVGFSAQQFHDTFAALPDVRFNFLLGSCHGGSFVDDLSALDNVVAALTAVDSTQGATPDWDTYTDGPAVTDTNASDVGSEWFSSIYAAAAYLSADNTRFAPVRQAADDAGVSHSTALLCLAADGALGQEAALGLDDDLDFSHFLGGHTPQRDCVVP